MYYLTLLSLKKRLSVTFALLFFHLDWACLIVKYIKIHLVLASVRPMKCDVNKPQGEENVN